MAAALGLQNIRPFGRENAAEPWYSLVVYVPVTHAETVYHAMSAAGAGRQRNYGGCAFLNEGEGRFLPKAGAKPFLGDEGKVEKAAEVRLEMLCAPEQTEAVITAMRTAHPYEEPAFSILPNHALHTQESYGMLGELPQSLLPEELAALPAGRWALAFDRESGTLELWNGEKRLSCPPGEGVAAFLGDPARQFVCYDCKSLYKELDAKGIRFRNCAYDVMLAAYVAGEGQGDYAPERLFLTWLGRMPAGGEDTLPLLLPLADSLTARLNQTAQWSVFADIEMPLASVLCDMEEVGFKIDRAAVRRRS